MKEFAMENSKLLNEVHKAVRIKHLSKRTEECTSNGLSVSSIFTRDDIPLK